MVAGEPRRLPRTPFGGGEERGSGVWASPGAMLGVGRAVEDAGKWGLDKGVDADHEWGVMPTKKGRGYAPC